MIRIQIGLEFTAGLNGTRVVLSEPFTFSDSRIPLTELIFEDVLGKGLTVWRCSWSVKSHGCETQNYYYRH